VCFSAAYPSHGLAPSRTSKVTFDYNRKFWLVALTYFSRSGRLKSCNWSAQGQLLRRGKLSMKTPNAANQNPCFAKMGSITIAGANTSQL